MPDLYGPLADPRCIRKGTVVTIRTSNGGEVTAALIQHYLPTYDAFIEWPTGGWAQISRDRITSVVEPLEP